MSDMTEDADEVIYARDYFADGRRKLENDGLIKLLLSGTADKEAQQDAAKWIAKLYGYVLPESKSVNGYVVRKVSDTIYRIQKGSDPLSTLLIAQISAKSDGWRVYPFSTSRKPSRKAWPSPREAFMSYYKDAQPEFKALVSELP